MYQKSVTFVTFEFQTPTRVPQFRFFSDAQKTLILLVYHGYLTRLSRICLYRVLPKVYNICPTIVTVVT